MARPNRNSTLPAPAVEPLPQVQVTINKANQPFARTKIYLLGIVTGLLIASVIVAHQYAQMV